MASLRRLIAASACLLGIVTDVAVGVALLRGAAAWTLILHPIAIAVWAWGNTPNAPCHPQAGTRFPKREEGDGERTHTRPHRVLVLALVALVLFPGFGVIGWAAGAALSRLPLARRARLAAKIPEADAPHAAPAAPAAAPDAPWVAVGVQPLVDVLREPNPAMRRAAIRVLGAEPTRDAVRLLQALLVDADPDVRSEASATLFRFENLLNRALADATAAAHAAPEDAARHAAVAAEYRRSVACDLLDPASARLYLTRAAAALDTATALAPERADLWLALARVQHERGESVSAGAALDRATALGASSADTSLLRMEIAFRAQAWETLAGLHDDDDADALRRWWRDGAADPTATARAAHEG